MKLLFRPLILLCYIVATMGLVMMTLSAFALKWLYGRAGWPSGLRAWNCWAFAIAKWLEQGTWKTYLVINTHGPIPHVRFAKSINGLWIAELKPINPKKGWRAVFDSVKFEGRVREGEGEEKKK